MPGAESGRCAVNEPRNINLELKPVPEMYAAIYRARGMEVPKLHSGHSEGALIPLHLRWVHRTFAKAHGFFWIPCPLCTREFGGHEIHDVIPDPLGGERWFVGICPFCTQDRNEKTARDRS